MESEMEIAALRQAARAGDVAAQTALGLRLLRGGAERAEGAALIRAAAAAGGGEARAVLAAFAAGGVEQEPNWNAALDLLTGAAEVGWEDARAELRFLAGDAGSDWPALRARVRPERWFALGPRPQLVSQTPRIGVVAGFLWPEACDWFIGLGQGKLKPAAIYDFEERRERLSKERTNSDLPFNLFQSRVSTCLLQARIESAFGAPVTNYEALTLMHYAPGEEFTPHHDFLASDKPGLAEDLRIRGQRVLTVLIYLNDDYEGGETEFPKIGFAFKAKRGDALVFANVGADGRPAINSLHAGRSPLSGEKWLLSQWIRNRPQSW